MTKEKNINLTLLLYIGESKMLKNNDGGIFAKLNSDVEAQQKLEAISKKQIRYEEEAEQDITAYESNVRSILKGEDVDIKELSKLDAGVKRGQEFKGEISDLAESLTEELQSLGVFFQEMSQYKGTKEKILSFVGLTRYANKARLQRVRNADVKENLQAILDYGNHMIQKLYTAILDNMACEKRIEAVMNLTSQKLEENQPKYEQWRAEKEKLQLKKNELQNIIDKADETEIAKLTPNVLALDKQLREAEMNEENYFMIVKKAKEAIPVQKQHVQAYADIAKALTTLRTGIEQDIEAVTEMYLAVPIAIQTALGTKQASTIDKGIKYATDKATDTLLRSAEGILDEAANRAEKPLIDPEQLAQFRKRRLEMRANYDSRQKALQEKHAAPVQNY